MTVIREYRSGYRSVEVAWGGSQRQCWFRQINMSVRLSAFHGLLHEMSIVLRARPTLPTMLSDKDIRDDCCALLCADVLYFYIYPGAPMLIEP